MRRRGIGPVLSRKIPKGMSEAEAEQIKQTVSEQEAKRNELIARASAVLSRWGCHVEAWGYSLYIKGNVRSIPQQILMQFIHRKSKAQPMSADMYGKGGWLNMQGVWCIGFRKISFAEPFIRALEGVEK